MMRKGRHSYFLLQMKINLHTIRKLGVRLYDQMRRKVLFLEVANCWLLGILQMWNSLQSASSVHLLKTGNMRQRINSKKVFVVINHRWVLRQKNGRFIKLFLTDHLRLKSYQNQPKAIKIIFIKILFE